MANQSHSVKNAKKKRDFYVCQENLPTNQEVVNVHISDDIDTLMWKKKK